VSSFVVRLWLPDRPGALGQVASRIGAARGDVVGIEILERGGGNAIDELVVSLPDDVTRDLLLAEIGQVDGVAVEDVRPIDPERPEPAIIALEAAAILVESEPRKRLDVLCDQLSYVVDGEWAVALRSDDGATLVERGAAPAIPWLAAFFAGSRHITAGDLDHSAPSDMVWTHLDSTGVSVAVGRSGRPFHTRERLLVALIGRIADGLLPASLDSSQPL
jgi:hypothetical protein